MLMRNAGFTAIALACAMSAYAGQTTSTSGAGTNTQAPGSANQTMTLVGCVGGGANPTDPVMLTDISLGAVGTTAPGQVTTATMPSAASAAPTSTGTSGTTSARPATRPTATE